MEKEDILTILEKNKYNIQRNDWDSVYNTMQQELRGEFSSFLFDNGMDLGKLFTKTIPASAFSGLYTLNKIDISSPVKIIEEYAFFNCESLTSVTIPDSVEEIKYCAFYWCMSLSTITIPKSVKEIGEQAFFMCDALTEIKFEGTEEEWNKVVKHADWNYDCSAKITFLK